MSKSKHYTLKTLAEYLQAQLHGDPQITILGLAALADAKANQISFFDNPKYHAQLLTTQASAVILAPKFLGDCPTGALVVEHPYVAYAKLAQLFWQKPAAYQGIHPTALVDPSATVGQNVSIGPYAVIGSECLIEDEVIIGAHCVAGERCRIGSHTALAARVTLYDQIDIGSHCVIHSGVVIGSDGFGFAPSQSGYEKIPQLGGVKIGNHVEIGANTTIDRGALNDTVIADGVKLDNQIQIGHNVSIGKNTVIAGCTGVAGSTKIGADCMIGGAVGIAGHIHIADNVMLTGMAMVTNSIDQPGVYASGTGILPRAEWQKAAVRFRQLNQMAKSLSELEKKRRV